MLKSLPEDVVEKLQSVRLFHHKEVGDEEELSASVVHESELLTSKEHLKRVLRKGRRVS